MASAADASPGPRSPSPPLSRSSSNDNPDHSPVAVNSDRSERNPDDASAGSDGVPKLAMLPASAAAPSAASSRRVPPPCWSVEETLALIDSYQEKWYALHRGNLRANHWQDVADAVSRRCQRPPASSSSSSPAAPKTPVQCRHKMEKLRKRCRSERQRVLRVNPNTPPISSWVFFRKMDAMEQGTAPGAPASARASPLPLRVSALPLSQSSSDASFPSEDEEDKEVDDGGGNGYHTARSISGMMANGSGHGGGLMGVQRFLILKNARSKTSVSLGEEEVSNPGTRRPNSNHGDRLLGGYMRAMPPSELAEMRRRLEGKRKEMDGGNAMGEVVAAVRTLADGFLRMEQMQINIVRETHKLRTEMELKRTEMMLDSQRRIVDSFLKDYVGTKRAKVSSE